MIYPQKFKLVKLVLHMNISKLLYLCLLVLSLQTPAICSDEEPPFKRARQQPMDIGLPEVGDNDHFRDIKQPFLHWLAFHSTDDSILRSLAPCSRRDYHFVRSVRAQRQNVGLLKCYLLDYIQHLNDPELPVLKDLKFERSPLSFHHLFEDARGGVSVFQRLVSVLSTCDEKTAHSIYRGLFPLLVQTNLNFFKPSHELVNMLNSLKTTLDARKYALLDWHLYWDTEVRMLQQPQTSDGLLLRPLVRHNDLPDKYVCIDQLRKRYDLKLMPLTAGDVCLFQTVAHKLHVEILSKFVPYPIRLEVKCLNMFCALYLDMRKDAAQRSIDPMFQAVYMIYGNIFDKVLKSGNIKSILANKILGGTFFSAFCRADDLHARVYGFVPMSVEDARFILELFLEFGIECLQHPKVIEIIMDQIFPNGKLGNMSQENLNWFLSLLRNIRSSGMSFSLDGFISNLVRVENEMYPQRLNILLERLRVLGISAQAMK
jgi:hypothetical protein